MSTGLELIPLALAVGVVVAAVRTVQPGTGVHRDQVLAVDTRLRDESVLAEALARCGGDRGVTSGLRYGALWGTDVAFAPSADGTFTAFFESSVTPAAARSLVLRFDAMYCGVLREKITVTLRDRAASLGLVASEPRPGPGGTQIITLTASDGAGAKVELQPSSTLSATTFGSKGAACLPWVRTIEHCAGAATVRSHYTSDFYVGSSTAGAGWDATVDVGDEQVEQEWERP